MTLPAEMPDGCNFYGVLDTQCSITELATALRASGWSINSVSIDSAVLRSEQGTLEFHSHAAVEIRGHLNNTDRTVSSLLGSFNEANVSGMYQWITANGELWREMPFDESMLDDRDARLPASIRESIKAQSLTTTSPRPWWRFW